MYTKNPKNMIAFVIVEMMHFDVLYSEISGASKDLPTHLLYSFPLVVALPLAKVSSVEYVPL